MGKAGVTLLDGWHSTTDRPLHSSRLLGPRVCVCVCLCTAGTQGHASPTDYRPQLACLARWLSVSRWVADCVSRWVTDCVPLGG